ncbi:MAG: two-component regulator propeller domain-containing protein [Breznakibacter sp.]
MRKASFLLLLFLPTFTLSALDALRIESITNKDGLSHNTIRYIMQDSSGFMWFSTINGLNRYDGHRFISLHPNFTNNSLNENNIRQTTEDKNGHIWVMTTSRYMHCYDTKTESFINYAGEGEIKNFRSIEVLPDGDVWLWGTEHGACFVHYDDNVLEPTLYDVNRIGTNVVAFVLKDSSGQTWIGTDKGLIQIINNVPKFCNTNNINYNYHSVIEIKDKIFFFTNNDGIVVYDKLQKVFLPTIHLGKWKDIKLNNPVALDEHTILITGKQYTLLLNAKTLKITDAQMLFGGVRMQETNSLKNNQKDIWIYNKSGYLWEYNKETKQFKKYHFIPEDVLGLIDMERFNVCRDSRGITWITTYGNGLFAIEKSGEISHFTSTNSGLKTDYLLSVSEDRTGNVWIGTENTGLLKIHLTKHNHQLFFPNPDKSNAAHKTIRCIYEEERTGDIWVGTKHGDVYVFDKNFKQKNKFSFKQGVPYCMMTDAQDNMWIGTKGNGLIIVPKRQNSKDELNYYFLPDDSDAGATNIYTLLRDNRDRMWVGTLGAGLYLCEFNNGTFQSTTFPALSNKQKQVRCMLQDSSGQIWVGGSNGIIAFNPDSVILGNNTFQWFHFDRNNAHSLNNNIVKAILEDSKQRIWIGTSGGGINLAEKDRTTGKFAFRHYTLEEGLISNMVQAILEDDNHDLWISTENGISKFNPEKTLFENYSFLDSWESDLFSESSAFKRKNGELLFGSFNGMYVFNPYLFESQAYSQPVILTGLAINGIPVNPNTTDSPLKESITLAKQIKLKNGQNSFSIEFSSLNFQSSYSNRYTYILENYENDWNPATQYNVATYKNIPAGRYLFKVKDVNNPHALNNDETQLEIIVIPPFWKSTKALILYAIFIVAAAILAVRIAIKMNKLHNDVVIEKQLTEFKLRFFTNISHEFRTPLTIIRGSIETMGSLSLPVALKKHIKILDKSTSKLLRLIDQLLEFRKLQNDHLDLRLEQVEVVSFLRGIYEMFLETAAKKGINLTFTSNKESNVILIDEGKIDKILFNLLSNAFKHTPTKGHIAVELVFNKDEERFILKVSDSGIGIPPEKQDLLFVRFKQINYASPGIGIGLNLSSELARAHKGEIWYEQSQLGGACFVVSIPISESAYGKEDIVLPAAPMSKEKIRESIVENDLIDEEPFDHELVTHNYKILVIEDDDEICSFLRGQLEKYFTVATAPDGLKGWKTAVDGEFDLIVCDVMLPEMDGFEITRKLKSDIETSHIPIILLTAHSSIEHQLEGINAGADSYITKPFSIRYLLSRITKLIEQRERLQYKFAHDPNHIPTTISTSGKDNEFIAKVQEIVEKHLENAEFSIDDFAREANMGRTLFYKKIKGITNLSPNEYLRVVRLKKAAELLRSTEFNVSEIAYKVGFNDPYYFSKCFKEQFKIKPTQFRHDGSINPPKEEN